ncbi:hypothetical protein ACSBL2_19455 [Pedobacter sp. AW31-3R]|uniref:hypothetical protein n=1 Tax=Pedobacter sp. AW31-3R TaxID=3445781 RepID=UPI003F9FC9D0
MHKLLIFSIILMVPGFQKAMAQKSFAKFLTPDYAELQHAGSIGYMSAGIGYNLSKKERTALSFHYGYVPEVKGGELHIAAVKFQYKPFAIRIKDKLTFYPVNPGVFLSYTFGKQFGFSFDDDQYPKGYYFWSPALREHISLSSELKIMGDKTSRIKSISLYTEANTNDLYMISWFENRTTTPIQEIFHLGFGVRMYF